MADYVVHYTDLERHKGPVEVYFARLLENGWVEVQRRQASKSLVLYPPSAIRKIRIPLPADEDEDIGPLGMPEEFKVTLPDEETTVEEEADGGE